MIDDLGIKHHFLTKGSHQEMLLIWLQSVVAKKSYLAIDIGH